MTTTGHPGANTTAEFGYPMRQWVFEDALGRYDIDLGDSHVECGRLAQLTLPADLELGYGVDRGHAELREQVGALYGGPADSVVITHGAQEALFLLYDVLLRPGDRVITFRPGWQQSWAVPTKMGCVVDVLDLDDDFGIDLDAVERAARRDLRLIVVNSPCNPTGRRIRPAELDRLLALVDAVDGYLLLDEEYVLDLSTSPAVRSRRVISVSSLSKVYGFPGLRVGWMYGPTGVVADCAERKHLTSISNSVLCEVLALDVLSKRGLYADEYRRLTTTGLEELVGWAGRNSDAVQLVPPEGTPFAWLHLMTGESALALARRALDSGVLVMPGETLGGAGGIRLSFAREREVLVEGLRRIEAELRQHDHAVNGAIQP